ncbi:glycoside hydrolase N-terminal domain-containing protein [Isoptericola jiangsuensis]|uniref:glycoside hydrolase N-terminal domain-containing protein n=1 Tax=Isoptericola jiangsuensis TaxID=548579 RepID=UPI003AADBE4F
MPHARHVITLDRPGSWFADSYLLGDRRLGASTSGGLPPETFDLNVDTLWSGGPVPAPRRAMERELPARRYRALELGGAGGPQPPPSYLGRSVVVDGVEVALAAGRVPDVVIPNYVQDDDPVRYAIDAPDEDGATATALPSAP